MTSQTAQLSEAKTRLSEAKEQIQTTTTQLSEAKTNLQTTATSLSETKTKLESVKAEYLEKESAAKKQIEQLTQTMTSQTAQLSEAKTQLSEAKTQLSEAKTQLSEAKEQIQTTTTQLSEAKEQIQTTTTQLSEAKEQIQTTNRLQSHDPLLESVKAEYLEKESAAKKQIEQLTQTMTSQTAQLSEANHKLESVKAEYLEKESAAKKQIEQLNTKIEQMKSSSSIKSTSSGIPLESHSIENKQLETLQKEYDEKLSQKKEIDEYLEHQLPAVTNQINQLNDEYARVSADLEKAKIQLETLQKEYDEKLSQKKEIDEYLEHQLPAVTNQINQLNDEYARVSADLEKAKSELNSLR